MVSGSKDDDQHALTELAPTEVDGRQTMPREDGPVAIERQHIGRFRIEGALGSGGMADVYRAYDPTLDRAVALKVLHTKRTVGDTQGMRRVLREARAAAALTHPNTVTIFEVGEDSGEVFIAMELLEGAVLREVLERGEASLEEKLRWLLQAARALAAAHERGLVHRDVKPENMFVCNSGSLKLLDFGIAKRDDEEGEEADSGPMGPSSLRTQAGRRLGTPRYMAPEQHAGLGTDARTDEYAWGLVAFELLCGSHAVAEQATATNEDGGPPAGASAAMRITELRRKVPDLSEEIARCIARALEPNKVDRFTSMDPIILALETTKKIAAPPAPPARSRGWVFAVAGALSVAAVVGIVRWRERAAAHAQPAAHSPSVPNALAPACHSVTSRSVKLGAREGMAVLPNGAVVFSRDLKAGLNLERETPKGTAPFMRFPMAASDDFRLTSLDLQGLMSGAMPSVFVHAVMASNTGPDPHTSLMLFGEDLSLSAKRIGGTPSGAVAASFNDRVVVAVTALTDDPRTDVPQGAALHVLGDNQAFLIETGMTQVPALATTQTRLGVAYQHELTTHFALYNVDLQRIGDVKTALPFPASTAVALVGTTAALFYTDTRGGKSRLGYVTLTPPSATFTTPKNALDDPLVDMPPITVRLPDGGGFAVAWLTSDSGGNTTLRVSPVGPDGRLIGPADVATSAIFRDLNATATPQGIAFSWNDGAGSGRIVNVKCQPQ